MFNNKTQTTMKKKALILAGLCVFGLFTWNAYALSVKNVSITYMEDNVPAGYEKIELKGDLLMGTGPNAIEAGANDNSVYLHFNQNFGNVNICIFNASGNLIYSNIVDTSVQQTLLIPVSNVVSGTCTVVLNNANGYAEGDFERN